jgi:hypothetical protein
MTKVREWYGSRRRAHILLQLEQQRKKIVNTISPLDFSSRQQEILQRRVDGTGKWLFQSGEFKAWIAGDFATLWCPGMGALSGTIFTPAIRLFI